MNTFWKVFLGLLTIAVIVSLVTLFNGARPVGSENLVGLALPDFAAPLASGTQNADANVYTPAQAQAAKSTAACDVDIPGAFNSCDDLKGESIVIFWNTTKSECAGQVAQLNQFVQKNPNVSAVAVAFDQSESSVREFVKSKAWKIPVAIDRDGAVAGLYAVAGCPSTFFAENGEITGVKLGKLTDAQLEAGIKAVPGATAATK